MMLPLAQRLEPVEEFLTDPSLTTACILLITVSIAWVVVARLIARKIKRAERLARAGAPPGTYPPSRDIWAEPP